MTVWPRPAQLHDAVSTRFTTTRVCHSVHLQVMQLGHALLAVLIQRSGSQRCQQDHVAAFPSAASSTVIHEGDLGDKFYIIKAGEAMVLQGGREVNRLFAAEFFGERALLADEPRWGDVRGGALQALVRACLTAYAAMCVQDKIRKTADQSDAREFTPHGVRKRCVCHSLLGTLVGVIIVHSMHLEVLNSTGV